MPNSSSARGLIQDSGQVSIADCGAYVGATTQVITRGLVRLDDEGPQSAARDWTLYQAVDWLQQGPDGDWSALTTRSLNVNTEVLQVGRGRVGYTPFLPPMDGRSRGLPSTVPWCRARATSFRGASVQFAVNVNGTSGGAGPDIIVRDNYRAWLCEGRTSTKIIGGTLGVLPQASVVTAGVYSYAVADIDDFQMIPDFATRLRIAPPAGAAITVTFLNQFGQPLVLFAAATVVTVPTVIPIPGNATMVLATAVALGGNFVPVEYECQL